MDDARPEGTEPAESGPEALKAELRACQRELLGAREAEKRSAAKVRALQEEVDALRRSMSWRISFPVRLPRMLSHWFRDLYQWTLDQVQRSDGVGTLLRQEGRQFRKHGSAAILCHLKTIVTAGKQHPSAASYPFDGNDYTAWLERYGERLAPSQADHAALATWLPEAPLISVVMPVYDPPPQLLREAIASVQRQIYPKWELCIADDASTDPRVREALEEVSAKDERIKVVFREENGHISATSNSALALASGRYIALLDHDDLMPADALFWVAMTLREHPDAAILYSDEDRIDESGQKRYEPYFKPDFNYELLLAQNMISHLGVYDRRLVEEVGGFRVGLEGSQDLDLALRIVERVEHSRVVHIPRILYHWRAIKGSTALENSEKGYASGAAQRAVDEHLRRTGQQASVEPCEELRIFHRVNYRQGTHDYRVSVILLGAADAPTLAGTLNALTDHLVEGQIELVFAGTRDSAVIEQALDELPMQPALGHQRMPLEGAGSFALAANRAVAAAKGDFFAFVECGIEYATDGWLEELASFAAQPRVGFVSPRICNTRHRLDHGGILFTDEEHAVYAHQYLLKGIYGHGGRAVLHQRFRALSPAVMLCRREVFERVGGLDEGFAGRLAGVDATLRADSLGYHNLWLPQATVTLQPGQCRGRRNLFVDRSVTPEDVGHWSSRWTHGVPETHYNPNLSGEGDFSLAWPPRLPSGGTQHGIAKGDA
jgi:glycosyltransferase involved in cell wall biosynthesis